MAVDFHYNATGCEKANAGIRRKRIVINESRGHKAKRMPAFEPQNAPWRQSKGEKTVEGVCASEYGNRPEQEVRPRMISAELKGKPKDACSRDESQEGQARQFAIDTDASINPSIQRIRSDLPYGMMQPV